MKSGLLIAIAVTGILCLPSLLFTQSYGERDTNFKISLSRRSAPPSGMLASIVTTSVYPCEGYTIRSGVTWERDTISLHLDGFLRPSPCIQTGSAATGSAFLGNVPDSLFFLRVTYRGETDIHKVRVRRGRTSITPLRTIFTELKGF